MRPVAMMGIVALMAVYFGINIGSLFSYREQLMYLYMLDNYDLNSILSVFLLGLLGGVFLGGFVIYGSGRKIGLLMGFAFGVAADCAGVLAPSFSSLLLSEIAAGVACGIFLVSSLIYAAEISSPAVRGVCGALVPAGFLLGLDFVIMCHDFFPSNSSTAVIIIAGIGIILILFGILRMPESPRWLARAGFSEAALSALFVLRGSQVAAARELALINERERIPERGLELFLHSGIYRNALWMILVLSFLLHICGMTYIPYSASELILHYQQEFLGNFFVISASSDYGNGFIRASITVAFFGILTAAILSLRMTRIGGMLCGIAASMGVLMLLSGASMLDFGSVSTMLLSVLILLFIYTSSLTLTVFLAVFVPEILPTSGREFGVGMVLVVNCTALLAGVKEIGPWIEDCPVSIFFAGCAFVVAFLLVVVSRKMPETSVMSLETIETRLFEDKLLRNQVNKHE